nr:MAG TPA: hypothetical protein [Caudoviricetes sp.]DAK95625.1 MAG TPA: hypothetical protein [Caudoviricetes sp.]DAU40150.1 MAG TPA: hypothetical protein [Caudoviricetes sp.]
MKQVCYISLSLNFCYFMPIGKIAFNFDSFFHVLASFLLLKTRLIIVNNLVPLFPGLYNRSGEGRWFFESL